nr:succinate dehydrogenase subunit 3 [Vernicia fordii]
MNILRPLSPHLPIYKPQLTSTFPISHRISGAFLATIVLFFYLLCLKIGLICFTYENFYQFFFFSSKLILISVEITALALSYHLYNGVCHLVSSLENPLRNLKKEERSLFFADFLVILSIYLLLFIITLPGDLCSLRLNLILFLGGSSGISFLSLTENYKEKLLCFSSFFISCLYAFIDKPPFFSYF